MSSGPRPHTTSRRAVLGTAAWAVPAIGLATATPARAASLGSSVDVVFPPPTPRPVTASLADAYALVRDAAGAPAPGVVVTFTAAGSCFFGEPGGTTAVVRTDADGRARAVGLTASPTAGTAMLRASLASGESATSSMPVATGIEYDLRAVAIGSLVDERRAYREDPDGVDTWTGQDVYLEQRDLTFATRVHNAGRAVAAGVTLQITLGHAGNSPVNAPVLDLAAVDGDAAAIGISTATVAAVGGVVGGSAQTDPLRRSFRLMTDIPLDATFTLFFRTRTAHHPSRGITVSGNQMRLDVRPPSGATNLDVLHPAASPAWALRVP